MENNSNQIFKDLDKCLVKNQEEFYLKILRDHLQRDSTIEDWKKCNFVKHINHISNDGFLHYFAYDGINLGEVYFKQNLDFESGKILFSHYFIPRYDNMKLHRIYFEEKGLESDETKINRLELENSRLRLELEALRGSTGV